MNVYYKPLFTHSLYLKCFVISSSYKNPSMNTQFHCHLFHSSIIIPVRSDLPLPYVRNALFLAQIA